VEADANNIEAEILGESKEALGSIHGGTKLHAETAQARFVISHDAEEELRIGEELGNLVELIGIVKSHLLDASRFDVTNIRVRLAGLGVDDALGLDTHRKSQLNLRLGGAIKASAKCREKLDDLAVGVALDGCKLMVG
jgi:hypothetical protein